MSDIKLSCLQLSSYLVSFVRQNQLGLICLQGTSNLTNELEHKKRILGAFACKAKCRGLHIRDDTGAQTDIRIWLRSSSGYIRCWAVSGGRTAADSKR